jgi:flagellar biosynthesis/type III secretory pathway M-ring protein FliF/YscJ
MQGDRLCECAAGYTGPHCVDQVVPSGSTDDKAQTTYIAVGVVAAILVIIVVIVVVVCLIRKKKNKNPEKADSETGYNNQLSMEARDREIYSTINKQPKAFHEKSFTSLDKDDDYGERTGIHL